MKNTSQIRMMFDVLIERHPSQSLEELMDKFYRSKTCGLLSDEKTGFFTYSHIIIADLFDAETKGEKEFDDMLYQINY